VHKTQTKIKSDVNANANDDGEAVGAPWTAIIRELRIFGAFTRFMECLVALMDQR